MLDGERVCKHGLSQLVNIRPSRAARSQHRPVGSGALMPRGAPCAGLVFKPASSIDHNMHESDFAFVRRPVYY